MFEDIILPFLTIGLAEFGDKTQLAIFCLASKTKKHWELLIGVFFAFLLADGLAILFGGIISEFIPLIYIKVISGIIFIIFGILTLKDRNNKEDKCELSNPLWSGFSVIFISELGDKTQIASGLFATKFHPLFVLIGVMLALLILSLVAIFVGKSVSARINKKYVSIVAGILFLLMGIACFF